MDAAPDVVYRGGTVFTADPGKSRATAVATAGERIVAVGGDEVAALAGEHTAVVDLAGGILLPGITDGHFHTLLTGEALRRADLVHARDLGAIQDLVLAWAAAHPDEPWVLGKGWLHQVLPDGRPVHAPLDAVVPDRPVALDANDYHSAWVNAAGLRELGITKTSQDPPGGEIVRDADGEPTGELKETAALLVWDHLETLATDASRDAALRVALDAMASSGITSVIDMAMQPDTLEAMVRADERGELTARVRGHWMCREPARALVPVTEAIHLSEIHRSPLLAVVGVKIVSDGTIDARTAAMLAPYADGSSPQPIWDLESLLPCVRAADAADLQVAVHAIGDAAVRTALDVFADAARANRTAGRRHRIEHIETIDPVDIPRFGELGVTASMQPVHVDPAIVENWAAMLGDDRADRGFAWAQLGAVTRLVFGTDAPTAPLAPLPNLHVAVSRRSSLAPGGPSPWHPEMSVPMEEALRHMTIDAAWSCRDETDRGSIEAGKLADLVVVDRDITAEEPEALLEARVVRTVVGGRVVYEG